ncbi:MAG: N-acetyltransferase [Lachnospiraceae bacterium]|nr:N-acetyltransferase [Lachnospiraceae bacterium]
MLRLRPFKRCDAASVASWLQKEETYDMWGGQLIGPFPLTGEMIAETYLEKNGLCEEPDNFYPVVAVDENDQVVGCFIIRYMNGDPRSLRFGWVVVDESLRSKGLGREMLTCGLKYAFDILGAKKITLGVYENNPRAYRCYRAVGFTESKTAEDKSMEIKGKKIKVIEMEITADQIRLEEVTEEEIPFLYDMQVRSFMPLYEKYHDECSPAIESIERVQRRFAVENRKYYFIVLDGERVGAINLGHNDPNEKEVSFISPLFILPEFQNQGIGYAAIQKAFQMYPGVKTWKLETILQEKGNCHLYEKCGFVRIGAEKPVNEQMTLIDYERKV